MTVLTAEAVLNLALGAGFTRAEANVMTVISHYESGWNPANVGDQTLSRYGSIGLWQIFTGAHVPSEFGLGTSGWNRPLIAELAVPATNAKAARRVYEEQGYSAWSTYNSHHGDAAWATLLASTEKIVPGAPASPPNPVTTAAHPRNYLAAKGNVNRAAAAAVEFEKAQVASGAASWKGLCASLVRNSYGISVTAWGSGTRTAAAAWHAVPGKLQHGWYNPPVGVPVFWVGGKTGAGHVAVADGNGNCWSSDFSASGYVDDGKVRLVPIASISAHDPALKYVGWAETYLGVRVYG